MPIIRKNGERVDSEYIGPLVHTSGHIALSKAYTPLLIGGAGDMAIRQIEVWRLGRLISKLKSKVRKRFNPFTKNNYALSLVVSLRLGE